VKAVLSILHLRGSGGVREEPAGSRKLVEMGGWKQLE